jgi:hypothetical protein
MIGLFITPLGLLIGEKNTSSNTGVTSNINNDADDILDQENSHNVSEFHKTEDDWAFYYSPRAIDRRS